MGLNDAASDNKPVLGSDGGFTDGSQADGNQRSWGGLAQVLVFDVEFCTAPAEIIQQAGEESFCGRMFRGDVDVEVEGRNAVGEIGRASCRERV